MSNTLNPAGIVEPYLANAIRGRFGYYIADHATYLRAKLANKLYWEFRKAIARRWRWERKTVNRGVRVVRERGGNLVARAGQPKHEPTTTVTRISSGVKEPRYISKKICARVGDKNCRRGWKWHTEFDWIPSSFHAIRMPQPSPVPILIQEHKDRIEIAIKELSVALGKEK